MRKWIAAGVMLAALTNAACKKTAQGTGAVGGDVAATVNGKNILRSEVEDYFKFRTQDAQEKPSGEEANVLRLEILRELIEGEIMSQRAEQLNIKPTDAEIDTELKGLKGGASDEEYKKTLAAKNVTEDELRKEITRNLLIQKVMAHEVADKIKITDSEITKFYDDNKDAFNVKEPMYRIGVIAVSADPSAPVANSKNDKALTEEQALRKIQDLETRLQKGENFQQLASEYSEDPQTAQNGGDLGYQPGAALDRFGTAFKTQITKMKVGETTPVVRGEGGYWIFKLVDIRQPGQHDLKSQEVQDSIRQELQRRRQQLLTEAFSEQVHNEARVDNVMAREIVSSFK